MKCSIRECGGDYERRMVTHTVRRQGKVMVIDHVPADVCTLCGDVLFEPQTVRRIEQIIRGTTKPSATVPLYEYA